MMWGYPGMGPVMLWSVLWGLIWLVLLGVGVWALVRWASHRGAASGPTAGPSSLEILRQRYARGEIDATAFEQMRERLEASYRDEHAPPSRS